MGSLAEIGLVRGIKKEWQRTVRGYTDEDVQRQRKILGGNITDGDREGYREVQRRVLILELIGDAVAKVIPFPREWTPEPLSPRPPSAKQSEYINSVREIDELTPEEVNERMRRDAQERLKSWGFPE